MAHDGAEAREFRHGQRVISIDAARRIAEAVADKAVGARMAAALDTSSAVAFVGRGAPPWAASCPWTKVEDGLPEQPDWYLVSTGGGVDVERFHSRSGFTKRVLAWAPLPEPYRA